VPEATRAVRRRGKQAYARNQAGLLVVVRGDNPSAVAEESCYSTRAALRETGSRTDQH
jgi:hypothetical protein